MDRAKLFDTLTKGVPTRRIAKAMDSLTPGISWYGSTKKAMRESFCIAPLYCSHLDKVPAEKFKAALDRQRFTKAAAEARTGLKIFRNTEFHGLYPVGTSAIVIAANAKAAAAALEAELGSITLPQPIKASDMIEVEFKPQVIILQDGNY